MVIELYVLPNFAKALNEANVDNGCKSWIDVTRTKQAMLAKLNYMNNK